MQSTRPRLLSPYGRQIYQVTTKGSVSSRASFYTPGMLLRRPPSLNTFHTATMSPRSPGGTAVKNRSRAKCSQTTRKSSRKSTSTSTTEQQSTSSREHETSDGSGALASFIAWYEGCLTRYPLVTKALTGGAIAAGGDFFCQTVLESDATVFSTKDYDPARSFRFGFLGTCFVAPTNHVWYRFLAKRVAPGKTWTSATTRTALDQFGWTPIYTFIWLGALWKMEGSSNQDIVDALQREYVGVMKANWLLWIPAQMLNFKVVPLKYQVLFTNVVELVWNAFLSYAATGKGEEKEPGNTHAMRKRQTAEMERS
mmetsp:Transcript_22288/g.42325  ORF Transcript_22288/g.42325 Transcript_22288/m.42325 type:complete len:311 (+) Transcript_22288:180-1112(+)